MIANGACARFKGGAIMPVRKSRLDPVKRRRELDLQNIRRRQRRRENPELVRARDRARYQLNPEKWRRACYRKHGLTPEQWNEMFAAQGFRCAACKTSEPTSLGQPKNRWHTDHNHKTGNVRGILCARCNVTLGHAQDDPVRLAALIKYLEDRSGVPSGSN